MTEHADDIGFTDSKVRSMLLRAGFDPTVSEDVSSFARFMRAMFIEYELHQRSRDTRRTWIIALSVAVTTTMIPIILHYLKVI